jgi:hypothetical protein
MIAATKAEGGTMYKLKRLMGLVAAVALAGVVPAHGLAGTPVVNDHYRFTSDPYPTKICGVDGTAVDTVVEHYSQGASGAFIDNVRFTSLFTATTSGKSLESSGASVSTMNGPIDDGDGTISFVASMNGLVLQLKIPNGPVLKDANGKPLLGAGVLTLTDIFDAVSGDYITTTESWHGPHPLRDGVDICGPVIAYLT